MSGLIEAEWDKWILSYNIIAQNGPSKSNKCGIQRYLCCVTDRYSMDLRKPNDYWTTLINQQFFKKCT